MLLCLTLDIDTILQPMKKVSKHKQGEAKFVQFVEEVNVRRSQVINDKDRHLNGMLKIVVSLFYCSLLIISAFEASRCTFKQNSSSWASW